MGKRGIATEPDEEGKALRIERLKDRLARMPAGIQRISVRHELEVAMGMYDPMIEARGEMMAGQIGEVRRSVARQRELTGATGQPESGRPLEPEVVAERRVPNPTSSWAQFLHELEQGAPDAGVQRATVNLSTLLGGFCRFRGTEAQQKAAARFKSVYERAQLGGSKAIDPSIEAVDGGCANPEAIFEIGADARREDQRIRKFLGRVYYAKLEFVIIGGYGPTAYARHWLKSPRPDGCAIGRVQSEVRSIVDRLSAFMGYQGK